MREVWRYKWALVKENKRYVILLFCVFFLSFVLAAGLFLSLPAKPLSLNEEQIASSVSSCNASLEDLAQKKAAGNITDEVCRRLSAQYSFYLSKGKYPGQFLSLSTPVLGKEFASTALFLQKTILVPLSFLWGCLVGSFLFATDFSSGRIKNLFCLNRTREKQFNAFFGLGLLLSSAPALLLQLALFFSSSPLWGEEITHWWNCDFYSQTAFSYSLSFFLSVPLLALFGMLFSAYLGSSARSVFASIFFPVALYVASFFFAAILSSDAPKGFSEIIPCYVPLGGFAWSAEAGQTFGYWIHAGAMLAADGLLFFAWRRHYVRADL